MCGIISCSLFAYRDTSFKIFGSYTDKFVTLECLCEVSKEISKENNSTYIRSFILSLQSFFALCMVSEQVNVPYCSYQPGFSAGVISLSGEAIIFSFLLSWFSENCGTLLIPCWSYIQKSKGKDRICSINHEAVA